MVNTSIRISNGVTIVDNIRKLITTPIGTISLHTNTTVLVTNLMTRNRAIVRRVRQVSHNCRSIIRGLGGLNTSVGHVCAPSSIRVLGRTWVVVWGANRLQLAYLSCCRCVSSSLHSR